MNQIVDYRCRVGVESVLRLILDDFNPFQSAHIEFAMPNT